MIEVDLITGFLGAGKTTFLKQYVTYWKERGQRIGIIENDFGAVNVDMMLLQDLEGEQCGIEMVAGGCDTDCHKRRLKTKLIAMGMLNYNRVIIEPSGIFDVDELFDCLEEAPLSQWYTIGNVITIVNAIAEENLNKYATYILTSQIAQAGKVIFSRGNILQPDEKMEILRPMNENLEHYDCQKRLLPEDCLWTDIRQLSTEMLDEIATCGYESDSHKKLHFSYEDVFEVLYFMEYACNKKQIENAVKHIFQDYKCGKIFRIKGFIKENNQWYQLNCTKNEFLLSEVKKGQEVLIVIGEELSKEQIDVYLSKTVSSDLA